MMGVGNKSVPIIQTETLRDRFAMAALDVKWKPEVAARKAYEYADAMMEARK